MILNISKIKTEALLLFCRDLINSYQDQKSTVDYGLDNELSKEFDEIANDMLKNINLVCQPNQYYLDNRNHFRPKAILKAYNEINKLLMNNLKENQEFNPSMLYFSMFAVWFKELDKEYASKEFIYFTLYPYFNVYDKLLVEMKNDNYKKINVEMVNIAEKIVFEFDKLSLV